jgi:hypothetical protein
VWLLGSGWMRCVESDDGAVAETGAFAEGRWGCGRISRWQGAVWEFMGTYWLREKGRGKRGRLGEER